MSTAPGGPLPQQPPPAGQPVPPWSPTPGPPPTFGPPPAFGPPPTPGPPAFGPPPTSGRRRPGGRGLLVLAAVLAVVVLTVPAAVIAVLFLRGGGEVPRLGAGGGPAAVYDPAADPFDGTPAEFYFDGAVGIEVPEPRAPTGFTTRQVVDALNLVEKLLVTSHLDRRMLVDHSPVEFLSLLSLTSRTELNADFAPGSVPPYVVQVHPDARLAAATPRVEGSMSFVGTEVNGVRVLEVRTRYVWVYPFQVGSSRPDGDLVTVQDALVWHVPHPDDVAPVDRGAVFVEGEQVAYNVDCATFADGLISPLSDGKAAREDGGPGGPGDPFDPNGSMAGAEEC